MKAESRSEARLLLLGRSEESRRNSGQVQTLPWEVEINYESIQQRKIGNYTFCSFSSKGIGRFKPEEGAHPTTGEIGRLESVVEEKIETICERDRLADVLEAIKKVHPYEEAPLDIYTLEES